MTLRVMTFNLRYASDKTPNSWSVRRPVVSACLRELAPDLIGTQEGFFGPLQDIARDRPELGWIGTGRGGGSHDEFAAIFYRRDRFLPLEYDHFWLSDTPNVIASNTWNGACVRMATWVRFRELLSGREFTHWNTHLDHESLLARENGAALLVSKIKEQPEALPLVLTGDFNAPARESRVYEAFAEAGLSDAWFGAREHFGPDFASFHGYETPVRGAHIDWIWTRGAQRSRSAGVVDFELNGQYPSDHFPIMATLEF